jgi:hypothetical protein
MGTGASTHSKNSQNSLNKNIAKLAVNKFRTIEEAVENRPEVNDEILGELILNSAKSVLDESGYRIMKDLSNSEIFESKYAKDNDERLPEPVSCSFDTVNSANRLNPKNEVFMDSQYIHSWLSENEANNLFHHLREIGERSRPKTSIDNSTTKYPLWSIYYGFKRSRDGARALDRWGSYHESWLRIEGIAINIHI